MVGFRLVLTLQPLLEQDCSSEASWFFFNPWLKFSALDDCTLRVASEQIINPIASQQGCTFNKVHLLPPVLLPSLLS